MDEIGEISDYVQDIAGNGADIILGTGNDEALDQHILVTVIATGFHENIISELVAHKDSEAPVSKPEKIIELDKKIGLDKSIDPNEEAIKTIYGENDTLEITLDVPKEGEVSEQILDLTDQSQAGTIDDMHNKPAYLRNKNKS